MGGFALRYQTHIMYVFGQLDKCGCYWLLIREPPTQKEVCLPGDESGGGGGGGVLDRVQLGSGSGFLYLFGLFLSSVSRLGLFCTHDSVWRKKIGHSLLESF